MPAWPALGAGRGSGLAGLRERVSQGRAAGRFRQTSGSDLHGGLVIQRVRCSFVLHRRRKAPSATSRCPEPGDIAPDLQSGLDGALLDAEVKHFDFAAWSHRAGEFTYEPKPISVKTTSLLKRSCTALISSIQL